MDENVMEVINVNWGMPNFPDSTRIKEIRLAFLANLPYKPLISSFKGGNI
jgi:hypothetical protein